jgi:phage-related protein
MTVIREPKPVDFIGSCKDDLQASPARGEFGHQLWEVQKGGRPPASRSLKTAGPGSESCACRLLTGGFGWPT